MKYISYSSAVETLHSFFASTPENDIVSLDEIFKSTGRPLNNPDLNKQWLANKLTHLKHYQLVTPIYTYGKRKTLDKIQLTEAGKKAIRVQVYTPMPTDDFEEADHIVNLETVMKDVRILRRQLPSFNVIFKVEPQEEEVKV